MEVTKAVITAARRTQRNLPLQMIIDRDGIEKSVLRILVEEAIDAGVDEICVIVHPGDEAAYAAAVGEHAGRLQFVQQAEQHVCVITEEGPVGMVGMFFVGGSHCPS